MQSLTSFSNSPHKSDGRSIYYVIAEDDGTTDNSNELCFSFKGTSVEELTEKLVELTGIEDGIIVCSRNPLNGLLCPLRLHLPPNNTMHIVVVRSSSRGQSAMFIRLSTFSTYFHVNDLSKLYYLWVCFIQQIVEFVRHAGPWWQL